MVAPIRLQSAAAFGEIDLQKSQVPHRLLACSPSCRLCTLWAAAAFGGHTAGSTQFQLSTNLPCSTCFCAALCRILSL